jgi:uncharacterized protein YbjT (DUF2867 family)
MATAYIGGAVAHAIVQTGHDVSGLTRDTEKAARLSQLGMAPCIGTLFDRDPAW